MASTCISSNSTYHDPTRVPITRACYENQYKWPESDARFLKPVVNNSGGRGEVVVVDSRSCRQLYLRSAYTFTRANEDDDSNSKDVKERAKKCFNRVRDRAALVYKKSHGMTYSNNNNSKVVLVTKVKHLSCASFLAMGRRMLACTPKVQA